MTICKSDGIFLLHGVKFQDGCFDFLSYHFTSCHITVPTSAKNDHVCEQYADRGVSPIYDSYDKLWLFLYSIYHFDFES